MMLIVNSIKSTISNFKIIGIACFILFNSFSAVSQAEFTSEPVTEATYGADYLYQVEVSNAGIPVFNTSGVPNGLTFNGVTRRLSGEPTETGSFEVVIEVSAFLNPGNNATQTFTLNIAKAELTVATDTETITYGDPIPSFPLIYSGFVNGDDESDLDTPPTATTSANAASNAGIYDIIISGGDDPNYDFIYNNSTLTIEKADQMITFDAISDKTYGDADFDLSASSTSGLDVEFTVASGPATISGSTLTITGAGDITVAANQPGNTNYNAAPTVERTFTVAKKALTVTAANKSIVFGEPIPALTFAYSGFVNGDDDADLDTTPTTSTTATAGSNAGTYPITFNDDGTDDNYSFTYVNATLTISKADQTISFTAIPAKTYGDAAFDLNASSSSGLDVDFTVVSGPATILGSTLTINGAGDVTVAANQPGNTNYNAAPTVERTFTVAKKVLTVTADNQSITFGQAIPTLTFAYSGFVNGDDAPDLDTAPTTSSTATAGSNAGTYPITFNDDGADDNYSFTYVNATLTINKAAASITITNLNQDYNGSPRPVTVTTNPIGLDFDITYDGDTEAPSMVGTYDVIVIIDEDNYEGTKIATLIIKGPVFTSTPVTEVDQGETYTYNIVAEDYNESIDLTISNIVSLPGWLTLTDNGDGTALLTGTPKNENVGSSGNGVSLRVSDGNGNTDEQFFDIEVINVNDPPIFTSDSITEATSGVQYTYNITTSDIDVGDEVTLTFNRKPSWLNFITTGLPKGQGRLQGTPQNSNRGQEQLVILRATDQNLGSTTQEFTINVDFPNTAPVFTSTPGTEATQDEVYTYNITVDDADNDEVTITDIVAPNWLNFDTDGLTATLSGTPGNAEVGEHTVVLQAEDFLGLTTNQNFTIVVENVNDAPEITSTPVTSAIQDVLYEYTIETNDIDIDDEVNISIVEKPNWLNFDGTSLLSGTPGSAEVENSPFTVEILATDLAGATDIQTFEITVSTQNQAPTIDAIASPAPILEDDLQEFEINLTGITTGGESNQVITIDISTDKPDLFEYLTVDYTSPQSTGLLRYKILPDSFGIATITLRLEDDGPVDINFFETSFQIEVSPVNDSPEFVSQPTTRIQPEENYRYNIVTRDADPGDQLSIVKKVGPAWLTLTDNGDGTAILEGQAPPTATNEDITIEVSDTEGATAAQNFVININQTPVVSNFTIEMQEDVPHQFTREEFEAAYSDEDDDEIEALKFNWSRGSLQRNGVPLESGDEIDYADTPNITYTPPANFFGTINLQWAAGDGFAFSEFANITLEIDTVNDAPILTSIESTLLEYVQGAAPINITTTITVTDVDDENMESAEIQILENYNPDEDRLGIILGVNSDITQNFDNSTGTLLLEGSASKSAYENALRTVTYQNINSLTTDTNPKSISFIVSDSSLQSEAVIRQLQVTSILPELDIVNAFTPDGSGVNDTWDFVNLEAFEVVNIRIYNTEGIEVYRCETNDCEWDGTYKGEPLPAKTYFYLINLDNGRRQYEGTVTILK